MNKMAKAMLGFAVTLGAIASAPFVGAAVGAGVAGSAAVGGAIGLAVGLAVPVSYALWDASGPSTTGKSKVERFTTSFIGLYANAALLTGTLAVGIANVLKKPFTRKQPKSPPPAYGERADFSIEFPKLPDIHIDFGHKSERPLAEKANESCVVKQPEEPKA